VIMRTHSSGQNRRAVCSSVFLTIRHCNFECRVNKKPHSFRLFFWRFCPLGNYYQLPWQRIKNYSTGNSGKTLLENVILVYVSLGKLLCPHGKNIIFQIYIFYHIEYFRGHRKLWNLYFNIISLEEMKPLHSGKAPGI